MHEGELILEFELTVVSITYGGATVIFNEMTTSCP